mgnify:CR=1 FL=1
MYINSNDKADTLRRNMKENESMKKWIVLTLALALALSLFAGCGKGADADETDYASMSIEELKPLLKTVTDGKLTVATSPDFAPYEFYSIDENENPTLAGFDIALAQYIADYLGLELEIIPMDFDGTLSELSAKKVDLALSGYSPDPAREDKMDFSDIYYVGGQSFVTVQDKADSFSALAEANKADYQIGAQLGSIQADLAKENTPDADIVELSKVTDIIAELLSGKLDGAFIETVVAEAYAKNYPELCVKFDVPYEQEGSVVGVSKGNGALLAAVNLAIAAAKEDGSMDEFVAEANTLAEEQDADMVLTYMARMIQEAKSKGLSLKREAFQESGRRVTLFNGVREWFSRINRYGEERGIRILHYINSSGLKEIIEGTEIAHEFRKIYACSFLYDVDGIAYWPAVAVNYTNKTQFIFKINKGVESVFDSKMVNRYIPENERPVPFKHMIYVGDGTTDIPCMRLVKNSGGHSIAVYNPDRKGASKEMASLIHDNRVSHVCPADYTEGSEMDILVKTIIDKIDLDDRLEKLEVVR